jgi:hypothetical protein
MDLVIEAVIISEFCLTDNSRFVRSQLRAKETIREDIMKNINADKMVAIMV